MPPKNFGGILITAKTDYLLALALAIAAWPSKFK